MVWRIGTPPYKALRAAYRHRLYVVGMFTWFLTLGLVVAGFQWNPNKPPVQKFVPAKVAAQTTEPQVAGAVTIMPTGPASSSASSQGLHVVSSATSQELVMPTVGNPNPGQSLIPTPIIVLPTEENPNPGQTPTVPVIVPPPSNPEPEPTPPPTDPGPVEPTPPEDPTPPPTDPTPPTPPSGPTLNPACAVDPLLNFALQTTTSVIVPVGGQSASQSVTTSDNSEVIWQPGGPVIWGDGTNTDTSSPVSMILTYNPGNVTAPSVGFFIRALDTAVPGATYTVSWHAEDGTRGICQTVNIQVTVEAAAPPPETTP